MSKKSEAQISPVMHRLSSYIAAALRKPLPAAVVEKTKQHILDTIAAMVSGSRLAPGPRKLCAAVWQLEKVRDVRASCARCYRREAVIALTAITWTFREFSKRASFSPDFP